MWYIDNHSNVWRQIFFFSLPQIVFIQQERIAQVTKGSYVMLISRQFFLYQIEVESYSENADDQADRLEPTLQVRLEHDEAF